MLDLLYVLCALTSLACAVLLWRGYQQSRARLLFWSAFCFAGLFANNVLLIVDTRVAPEIDLALVRVIPALLGAFALVYGFIRDSG